MNTHLEIHMMMMMMMVVVVVLVDVVLVVVLVLMMRTVMVQRVFTSRRINRALTWIPECEPFSNQTIAFLRIMITLHSVKK